MSSSLSPGLIVLHGNQLELLRDAVFDWTARNPLDALETEIFLVQSNGVAEWLKIALAERQGICAACELSLPARFLWQVYRRYLGPAAVPYRSPFDKGALVWRLMRLLPNLPDCEDYRPLRHFLGGNDPQRRLQLAERIADLFDQYQVYRSDWLTDWAEGLAQLNDAVGVSHPLAATDRWQMHIWRALREACNEAQRESGRASIHERFVAAVRSGAEPVLSLPRRVVVFGVSALPQQTIEALAVLAERCQVILAVPNPCRFYWGDIIEGRELFAASRRRQALRGGRDLAKLPLEALHLHSHPLLASWGRQGRDFVRLLDRFDDADPARLRLPRIDLFDEAEGGALLGRVQAAIRDLLPLAEHPGGGIPKDDHSIEFVLAHSPLREVEILHDRLLDLLAQSALDLKPRNIVVMVPQIETFAAAIAAVFGQYPRDDARHIPYEIADVHQRQANPVVLALDWLLQLPVQRCRQSEVRDFLDVAAVARRFGLDEDEVSRLGEWINGVGIRWGLDQAQRERLGLGSAGGQNTWLAGLQRMLLGYACGGDAHFSGIEAYGEIAGLEAGLAGSLADCVEALRHWSAVLATEATPAQWGERGRQLLADFFRASEDGEVLILAQAESRLAQWLDLCAEADFSEPVPLPVFREAWLGSFDEAALNHRFVSGGVTFCTLMPMRSVPYRVVCLLGLNDGDFPRRVSRSDFDLLARPGLARPGDRSRRDDDRYLMLEALLSARDKLYLSWTGRSSRDNSSQPPSVLVAQLRDYLEQGWGVDLASMTTEHPLQPFSRRYFEADGPHSWATEWRAAYCEGPVEALPGVLADTGSHLNLATLVRFARRPVREYFRETLSVAFDDFDEASEDDEAFGFDGLQKFQIIEDLIASRTRQPVLVAERVEGLARSGRLPVGGIGERWKTFFLEECQRLQMRWQQLEREWPTAGEKLPVYFEHGGLVLEDWIAGIRRGEGGATRLELTAGNVCVKDEPRADKLIEPWLNLLAASAVGLPVSAHLLGRDALIVMRPVEREEAKAVLESLIECWAAGIKKPLPVACLTALDELKADGKPWIAYDGDQFGKLGGECLRDPALARQWPDYESLAAEPGHFEWGKRLYAPLLDWIVSSVEVQRFDPEGAA